MWHIILSHQNYSQLNPVCLMLSHADCKSNIPQATTFHTNSNALKKWYSTENFECRPPTYRTSISQLQDVASELCMLLRLPSVYPFIASHSSNLICWFCKCPKFLHATFDVSLSLSLCVYVAWQACAFIDQNWIATRKKIHALLMCVYAHTQPVLRLHLLLTSLYGIIRTTTDIHSTAQMPLNWLSK